jgi:hypothetical protein
VPVARKIVEISNLSLFLLINFERLKTNKPLCQCQHFHSAAGLVSTIPHGLRPRKCVSSSSSPFSLSISTMVAFCWAFLLLFSWLRMVTKASGQYLD